MALVPRGEVVSVRLRNRVVRIKFVIEARVDMVGLEGDDGLERIHMRRESPVGPRDVIAELNDRLDGSLFVGSNL